MPDTSPVAPSTDPRHEEIPSLLADAGLPGSLWANGALTPEAWALLEHGVRSILPIQMDQLLLVFASADACDTLTPRGGGDEGPDSYHLCNREVPDGATLELLMANGSWITGRYKSRRRGGWLDALFYFDVPCRTRHRTTPRGRLRLPSDALLRWPRR